MPIQRVASWVSVALGRDSGVVNRLRPWYEQALVLMTLDRGLSWSLNGMPCRIDPRQRHRMARDYDQPVALWLSQHVKAGDLCANVGGNIGVYALQFAHWNGPEGRVVVFEPNPYARAVLARHIRYNHFNARIQVIDAAVAETNGTATFYASNTADGMSRLGMPNHELSETVPMTVRTLSLDSFFSSAPVWMMIDVEGFELQVLRGARRIISQCRGIVVELHPGAWSVAGTGAADLRRLLEEHSLQMTPLSGQVDPFTEYGHVLLQHVR